MTQVQETTNYDKFKIIRGNRLINREYLKKLTQAIADDNMLFINPIIVNEKMQVIDGQHRLEACKKLSIPVNYVVFKGGNLREVRMLNSNVRNWTMENYLTSYTDMANPEYLKIRAFMDKTGLSLGVALLLLTGNPGKSKNNHAVVREFKNGDFKANQEEYAYNFYKKLKDVSKFSTENSWTDRDFISALGLVYRNGFTHEELIALLEKTGTKIPAFKNRVQYIRLFEDLLGYKKKTPVRLI